MAAIVKEPATVTVPESLARVIGIFFFIGFGMMADMVAAPLEGRILEGPTAGDENTGLDPVRAFKALVRYKSVIADGNTHASDDVHHRKQHPVERAESVVIAVQGNTDHRAGHNGAEEKKVSYRKDFFDWYSFSRCREHGLSLKMNT